MSIQRVIGGVTGAASGAAMGSAAGPWGTAAGALVGGIGGALSAPKKVNVPQVPLIDYEQLKLKQDLERKRKAVNAGVSTEMATATGLINSASAAALESVSNVTGGDVGSALAGMESVNRASGSNVNALLATMTAQDQNYATLIGDSVNQMATRRASLELMDRNRAMSQNDKTDSTQNQDIMSTLGSPAVMSMIAGAAQKGGGLLSSLMSKSPAATAGVTPSIPRPSVSINTSSLLGKPLAMPVTR